MIKLIIILKVTQNRTRGKNKIATEESQGIWMKTETENAWEMLICVDEKENLTSILIEKNKL